jgi:hypothetical protein
MFSLPADASGWQALIADLSSCDRNLLANHRAAKGQIFLGILPLGGEIPRAFT